MQEKEGQKPESEMQDSSDKAGSEDITAVQARRNDSRRAVFAMVACLLAGVVVGVFTLWMFEKYKGTQHAAQSHAGPSGPNGNAGAVLDRTNPKPGTVIRIGMEYEEVLGEMGPPLHTSPDTYRRKTGRNEYELLITWGADDRESRLNPKARVSNLIVVPDKPATVSDVVADVPEILAWCSQPCMLVYQKWLSSELIAYSTKPRPADLEWARFAIYHAPKKEAIARAETFPSSALRP